MTMAKAKEAAKEARAKAAKETKKARAKAAKESKKAKAKAAKEAKLAKASRADRTLHFAARLALGFARTDALWTKATAAVPRVASL